MGEGLLGGLGHVEVLAAVELPHVCWAPVQCWGGDGEQEVAGLGVVPDEGEASLVEQVADFTEAEEGLENVVLHHSGAASALGSEQESVLLERPGIFVCSGSKICAKNNNICS